jgi:hypothetical protein
MCAQLLEHVAFELPATVFRGAMASVVAPSEYTRLAVSRAPSNAEMSNLIDACVCALHRSTTDANAEIDFDVVCARVLLCASDPNPVLIFTSSFANSMQSALTPSVQTKAQTRGYAHQLSANSTTHVLLSKWILTHVDALWDINTAVNESLHGARDQADTNYSTVPTLALTDGQIQRHSEEYQINVNGLMRQSHIPFTLYAYTHGNLCIDECIFGLLFATLSSSNLCFAHSLLGIQAAIEYSLASSVGKSSDSSDIEIHASTLIPDMYGSAAAYRPANGSHSQSLGYGSAQPAHVLGAILQLLSPPPSNSSDSGDPNTYDFMSCLLVRRPSLAMLAYEFMYMLCSSPISANIVLAYLRRRSIEFIHSQLSFFVALVGVDIRSLCVQQESNMGKQSDSQAGLETRVELIRTARNHCLGWLLNLCAIEIRILGETADIFTKRIKMLLRTLVFGVRGDATAASASAALVTAAGVQRILDCVCDHPPDTFTDVNNPLVLQCLEKSTVPHNLHANRHSRTQTSSGSARVQSQKRNEFLSGFSVVDLPMFINLLEETHVQTSLLAQSQIQAATAPVGSYASANTQLTKVDIANGIQTAMEMNIYQLRLASCTHLTVGLTQLLECCVFDPHVCSLLIRGESVRPQVNTHDGRSMIDTDSDRQLPSTSASYTPSVVASVQDFFEYACLPLLRSLFVSSDPKIRRDNLVEMIIAEKLVHCLVAILDAMRSSFSTDMGTQSSMLMVPLTHVQHEQIIRHLCAAVATNAPALYGNSTRASTNSRHALSQSSVYFRGYVYTALILVLAGLEASQARTAHHELDEDEIFISARRCGLPIAVGIHCRDIQTVGPP